MHFPYGALETVTVIRRLRNRRCIIIISNIMIIINQNVLTDDRRSVELIALVRQTVC